MCQVKCLYAMNNIGDTRKHFSNIFPFGTQFFCTLCKIVQKHTVIRKQTSKIISKYVLVIFELILMASV